MYVLIYTMCLFSCSDSGLPILTADRFPHVSLGVNFGPTSGVLKRHLMASAIHLAEGVWPTMTHPLYRLVRWVNEVWLLYNHFLGDLELHPVSTGKLRPQQMAC